MKNWCRVLGVLVNQSLASSARLPYKPRLATAIPCLISHVFRPATRPLRVHFTVHPHFALDTRRKG
jgi:hypothetical protein